MIRQRKDRDTNGWINIPKDKFWAFVVFQRRGVKKIREIGGSSYDSIYEPGSDIAPNWADIRNKFRYTDVRRNHRRNGYMEHLA